MRAKRIAVIGAGVAGLAATIDLARQGHEVTLFERSDSPGGKLCRVTIGHQELDAGPTVFTLRHVFDELFEDAGDDFGQRLALTQADLLARHAWSDDERLDLYADRARSADAIGIFAGKKEAAGFLRFAADAEAMFKSLDHSFMRASHPTPWSLVRQLDARSLWNIRPFINLWRATGRYFDDPRLRQLFSRYATYCGSSPFAAPATLMLVAHAEQAGLWYVQGGMYRLSEQLAALATRTGATLRYNAGIERLETAAGGVCAVHCQGARIPVDAVVCSADTNALSAGEFGDTARASTRGTAPAARSLSAVTWNLVARTRGFPLAHHSVFFSRDYAAEFDDIFARRRIPLAPTVYVCAQDRREGTSPPDEERIFCLINAPAIGDEHHFSTVEIESCENRVFEALNRCGLTVERRPEATVTTTPTDFNFRFPSTGGSLYGPALHSPTASFKRASSRSAIRGLYLAGGSTHPGPGIPMAALSGRLAAQCVATDLASTRPCR